MTGTDNFQGLMLLREPADAAYEALPGATGMELLRLLTDAGSTDLGGGFARFGTDGELANWTLKYDETFYVIHGEFSIEVEGTVEVGRSGDVLLIKRGTTVTYRGSAGTKVFFVLYPRTWNA